MNMLEFNFFLRGTASCMNIIAIATKGGGQMKSNYTYFADSRFSSVKTSEKEISAGVYYCWPAKIIHKGFVSLHYKIL